MEQTANQFIDMLSNVEQEWEKERKDLESKVKAKQRQVERNNDRLRQLVNSLGKALKMRDLKLRMEPRLLNPGLLEISLLADGVEIGNIRFDNGCLVLSPKLLQVEQIYDAPNNQRVVKFYHPENATSIPFPSFQAAWSSKEEDNLQHIVIHCCLRFYRAHIRRTLARWREDARPGELAPRERRHYLRSR